MKRKKRFASTNAESSSYYHNEELTQVNISALKKFVFEKISKDNPLRELVLSEPDRLDVTEFLILVKNWLRLLRLVYP